MGGFAFDTAEPYPLYLPDSASAAPKQVAVDESAVKINGTVLSEYYNISEYEIDLDVRCL